MEDPDKILLPRGDLVLVALCKEESGDHVPFALLGALPLDLGYGTTIEASVS